MGIDVRVVQTSGGVGFSAESLLKFLVDRQIRGQQLDGDNPVGLGVMGSPYLTHAAAAQQLHQAVPPERGPVHISLPAATVEQHDKSGDWFALRKRWPGGSHR